MSERNGEETFIVPEVSTPVLRLMSVKQQNADPFGDGFSVRLRHRI
jgi:hypothetical protein